MRLPECKTSFRIRLSVLITDIRTLGRAMHNVTRQNAKKRSIIRDPDLEIYFHFVLPLRYSALIVCALLFLTNQRNICQFDYLTLLHLL